MYTGRQFNRYIAVSFEPQLAIDWVHVGEVQFFRSLPLSPPSTNTEYTISSSLRSTQSTTFTLMILYYILIQIIEYCTTKEHTLSMCIQLLLSNWVCFYYRCNETTSISRELVCLCISYRHDCYCFPIPIAYQYCEYKHQVSFQNNNISWKLLTTIHALAVICVQDI